jgi:hypothetical protein
MKPSEIILREALNIQEPTRDNLRDCKIEAIIRYLDEEVEKKENKEEQVSHLDLEAEMIKREAIKEFAEKIIMSKGVIFNGDKYISIDKILELSNELGIE